MIATTTTTNLLRPSENFLTLPLKFSFAKTSCFYSRPSLVNDRAPKMSSLCGGGGRLRELPIFPHL